MMIEKAKDLIKNPGRYTKATSYGAANYVQNLKFLKYGFYGYLMGDLLQWIDMKLQENKLYFWIKDFLHKRLKKFWQLKSLAVTIEKSTVLRVTKTQNTMLFDLLSAILTFFAT